MNKNKKEYRFTEKDLLNETIRIADRIIAASKYDKDGRAFQTIAMDNDLNVFFEFSSSVYKGNEGICLFFIELYKYTGETKYLQYAEEGMKYIINFYRNSPQSGVFSFITGRAGTAYTMIRLYEMTGKKEYYEEALVIIRSFGSFFNSKNNLSEYINGAAGALMGLLLIHRKTGLDEVLELINDFTGYLISNIFADSEGVFWDRDGRMIRSLCGFSHGASGIGYVFLELGRYFKNEAFYLIAEQAFMYENKYFIETDKNWIDLRKGIWKEKDLKIHREEYLNGNLEYFTTNEESSTSAWCHGAMGIGLARLRAFETLGGAHYREVSEICLENVIGNFDKMKEYMSPTVCHGIAGNSELFLEAGRVLNDDKYTELAWFQADEILKIKQDGRNYRSGYLNAGNTEDHSLFIGNAGIGYFFLRLLSQYKTESILMPRTESESELQVMNKQKDLFVEKHNYLNIDRPGLMRLVLSRDFKHTLCLLDKFIGSQICYKDEYGIKDNTDNIAEKFKEYVTKTISSLKEEESELLNDALNFEYSVFEFDRSIKSYCYLYIKSVFDNEAAGEIETKGFGSIENSHFRLSEDSKIISSIWDWSEAEKVLNDIKRMPLLRNTVYYLLKQRTGSTEVTRVSGFTLLILNLILEGKSITEAYNAVAEEIEPGNERVRLRTVFEAQVNELIKNGIISKTDQ